MAEKAFFNRAFLREFIHMYRDHQCLWDRNSKDYRNEQARFSAYSDLHAKLLEINKNATIQTVKSKIINIRTTFFHTLKKFEASIAAGEEYSISLWYFPELLFLTNKRIPNDILEKIKEEKFDLLRYEEENRLGDLSLRTRQSVKKFIKLYQQHDCLWNVKSKYYSNKRIKLKALESIRKVFVKYSKDATILGIKNKIKSLRTCFKREVKKVKDARNKGEIYIPTLYYFDDLLFLVSDDAENYNFSQHSLSNLDRTEEFKEFENIDIESFYKTKTESNIKSIRDEDEDEIDNESSMDIDMTRDIAKKENNEQNELFIDEMNDDSVKDYNEFENADTEDIYSDIQTQSEDYLEDFQEKRDNKIYIKSDKSTRLGQINNYKEDEITTYAKYIGYELRLLSNEDRNFVQKIINDTIFQAKRGNAKKLTLNTN